MTNPTNTEDRSTPSREAGLSEEVRRTIDALNAHIVRASDFGLRVEIDVIPILHASRRWPTPIVSVQLTRTV